LSAPDEPGDAGEIVGDDEGEVGGAEEAADGIEHLSPKTGQKVYTQVRNVGLPRFSNRTSVRIVIAHSLNWSRNPGDGDSVRVAVLSGSPIVNGIIS